MFVVAHVVHLAFDFVEAGNCVQRLLGQLAFVRRVQVEGLAAGVGHAADFGDALLKAGLVASEVVADQLAITLTKKIARMLACTTGAEFVDHGLQIGEGCGAIGPEVSPAGLLLPRCKHRNRGFVSMDHALGQRRFAQGIDQRLELYAGLPDPLRQRRAGDGQAGTAKDLLLPVQWQVIGKLGHHHVSQQAGGGDALVDHLGRLLRLDQPFALAADPFPTHVLFDGEHARRVVELFADIFAHALQLAAAGALGVFGLVVDTVRGNCAGSGARLGCWRGSGGTVGGYAAFSSASMAAMSVSIRSSNKLPWAGLSCSLPLANL